MKRSIIILSALAIAVPAIASGYYPFMVQAPTANWSDPRQQNGCEEASAIMAVAWARGEKSLPTGRIAEKYILDMANWETRRYRTNYDTSAKDTADRLLRTYQNFTNYKIANNISLAELKKNIQAGKAVIAPMNGKLLKNPYYSDGGPDVHMLLIIGYDSVKKEFITNDPGTRRGQNFRYPESRLYGAIRDYPTGAMQLPIRNLGKNVIIISKVR